MKILYHRVPGVCHSWYLLTDSGEPFDSGFAMSPEEAERDSFDAVRRLRNNPTAETPGDLWELPGGIEHEFRLRIA